jgi:3-oxoacyl-[acyl-carrier protein] reductase
MELGLRGKVALVGGGSRGMGRAVAEALAREGASVALYARSEREVGRAADEIAAATGARTLGVVADVTAADDCARAIDAAVARFGGLDVLVTNMGGPPFRASLPWEERDWREAWELVTASVIRLCQLAVPHMRRRSGGSIVNVTTCGVHQLIEGTALSSVARLATTGFAKYLAAELARDGIRVNNVLPGWISTQRVADLAEGEAAERGISVEQVLAEQTAAVPMARFGTPEEVADAIVFLASDRAAYVTGVNLRIDGGWCTTHVF